VIENLFKKHFGADPAESKMLNSDGSDRQIFRLRSPDRKTVIGIINEHLGENKAFINFSGHFLKHGLNVPHIFEICEDQTCYLMEDLGDTTLLIKISTRNTEEFGETEIELYKDVINQLVRFQIEAGKTLDYSLCYQHKEFGKQNIEQDLKYFIQSFLRNFYPNDIIENRLNSELDIIKDSALKEPRDYFLYRDFQSRNIMIKDNKLYFIDYQSGRKGALQYDLASLLYDAKANVPQEIREKLIEHYIEQAKKYTVINDGEFRNRFWFFAVIRILQAMGAYGYLGITKGKKKFLESIPYALVNIGIILNEKLHDVKLDYFREIFKNIKYET
jgi:aminoglycoside/choline kinase family phosphotransferase